MTIRYAVLLMVALLTGCPAKREDNMKTDHAQSTDLNSLSKELGIPLPQGTKVLWVDHQSGMDDMVRAKLQLTRAAFDEIVPRLPIGESSLRAGPGRLGTDIESWNPHGTPGLRSGSVALEGGRFLLLGIAEDGAGQVTMFVANHGT